MDTREVIRGDPYFMGIAKAASKAGTCKRKQVGSILVLNKNIVSTGYNGSADGMPHCTEEGCMMENDHCVRTLHAEANAILQVGVRETRGATLYTTASPCWPCFNMIMRARIVRVVYAEFYRDMRIFEFAQKANIELFQLKESQTP